ncbi:hypothetical protein [Acinetobacter nosocomialis]|uniref:hypothetical protein n=1 Tax=Acinetobacter nosocomialis TaxID=106654 RepID=UPI0018FF2A0A|nr:hypothetical protein [Acinetobacter nosocomialis]MBJ8462179.1 hypothetical protein [Acinetobacter nosocomialis]
MNILDFFGKKKGSNFTQILNSLRVKNGIVLISVSGFTHTFEVKNCRFTDENSYFDIENAQTVISPISIDSSDVIYFTYTKKMDGMNEYVNTRFTLDNSNDYKKLNQKFVSDFYKVKNQ